jgi:hypothetical protein
MLVSRTKLSGKQKRVRRKLREVVPENRAFYSKVKFQRFLA